MRVNDPVGRNPGKDLQVDAGPCKDKVVVLCNLVVTPIGPVSYAERQTDCLTSSEIKN